MKVSIEIPQRDIKRAAYLLLSQEKCDEEGLEKVLESFDEQTEIEVSNDLLGEDAGQIRLAFALAALASKAKEMEDGK